ncbi:apolipo protein O-domain-containing protein [Amylostereum chailletii]|nr:apolipo protein O-domain-containing protein [Amylostereum chailletii]
MNQHEARSLPIYPAPDQGIIVIDSPSELEKQIGAVRRSATGTFNEAHAQVQGVVSKWIGIEHAVEARVKSIISRDESLTPGLLYVGVASLTGSIFARNRFILTRLALPPALFFFSLDYFLPKTSHNLAAYLGSLEDKHFPAVAEKHEIANAHSAMAWERLKEATRGGKEKLEDGVGSIVHRIQEATGLKVEEALGKGKVLVHEAKVEAVEKVHDIVHKAEKAVQPTQEKVKEKVEEVKRIV